ncbi:MULTISPECIES: acetyltransferase [Bacteroides]|jgi:sugar O-acyltransferase (sialic acid O-acetyltransferase NeuD family)|uniref:acetyltransferase n=1 Tax=Bacteroides TaxID=816 RepID=UPI002030D6A8|nr:acetyltransferase [Bacteroides fragilis]MCM0246395.1 acetyltransferase [Bacteroides fragilis]MCM0254244.1 acetyltransferase [Bacteroides fragilis]
MFLYGASGHAKVIIDILRAGHESIEALFDDNVAVTSLLGHPVLRPSEVRGPLIVSIGNNRIRKRIVDTLSVEFGYAIHPLSIVSELADIGEGSVVMQGSIIQVCAQVGRHCIINTGASVDHECVIEDYVHISPHSTLCGNVSVGEGSWIGAGTTVIPGVKIGKWSVIGAGSVVTKDIPDHVLAAGNRCKIIKSI